MKLILRVGVLLALGGATAFAWWRVHHKPEPAPVVAAAAPQQPQPQRDWAPIVPNRLRVVEDPIDPDAGKPRFGECAVYVDGEPLAVLSYGELPPDQPVHWVTLEGGGKAPRFLMAEYLEGLGIDVRKVRQLHLYGGRNRIAILEGDQLRRFARRFMFSFTRDTTGKPRMHPPGKGFHISDLVDTFSTVVVYVNKQPPRWRNEVQSLVDDKGQEIDGIPYTKGEMRGGVRVYVDARLAVNIKRNLLSSSMTVGQDEKGKLRYSLDAFLRAQHVDLSRIRATELVVADRVVYSARPEQLPRSLEFETIPDSSGTMLFHVSKPAGGAQEIEVNIVRLYTRPRALALR